MENTITDTDRIESLLAQYPGRWPLTEEYGNTLSLDGLAVLDDRGGGEVNRYETPPTDADLIDELDCQESTLA